MDDPTFHAITDPASVLVGLGAIAGIFAALSWMGVARSIDTSGEVVTGPNKRKLGEASAMTAVCLGLASFGYLLGRFNGTF